MKELSQQLLSASEMGNIVTVRALLTQVQVDICDQGRNTSLMYSAKEGHVAVVRLLLRQGANPDCVNTYGWTALMQASGNGHVRCVKCLLEFGANTELVNLFQQSALVIAAAKGNNDIVQSLTTAMSQSREEKGPEFLQNQLCSALCYAAYHGYISTVKLLLHFNSEAACYVTDRGWDALLFAVLSGDTEICRTLLSSATPPNSMLFEVLRATHSPDKSELMALLSESVSLTGTSKAISMAIECGDLDKLKEVIGLADAESNRLMGGTPLMFASVMGQAEIVRWLLEAGCDINAQDDNNQWTALMQAVFHGHYRIVEYLLSAGADPAIGNPDGLNAHSIATMLNDDHLSEMLVKYCRVPGSPGKKWWMKLTTKFSTIRALTAFKGKIKDGAVTHDTDEEEEEKEDEKDKEDEEKKEGDDGTANADSNGIDQDQPDPLTNGEGGGEKDEELTNNDDGMAEEVEDMKLRDEQENEEEENNSKEIEAHLRKHDTKAVLNLTHSHIIEVQPKIVEELSEEEKSPEPVIEDVISEDIVEEEVTSPAAGASTNSNRHPQGAGGDLISPDSGFISRAHSIPLDSQLIQSEYDGLNVDIPSLPPDIQILEPNWDSWYPEHVQLTEDAVRTIGAPEDVIKRFKQLSLLSSC